MASGCHETETIYYEPGFTVVTLSVHRSYNALDLWSLSVCHFSILEKAPISGLKLTLVYILGDDLSPLNVALLKSKLFWRKSEWNFGRNCSDLLLGHRPVIKQFST